MSRSLRALAVSATAAIVISACSSGGGTAAPGGSGGASQPAASASAASTAAPACEGQGDAGAIYVLSLWGGSEEEAFKAVLCDFQEKAGYTVNYEADRQTYATTLQARITGGNPPDVAIIPGIGNLRRFAKDESLKKISDLGIDEAALAESYPAGFLAAGQVDGEQYAIPAKYNNKGTVWYRPDLFEEAGVEAPLETWEDFTAALDTLKDGPGALSLGAKDDWTLSDWFEAIYIREQGVEAYDRLFGGPDGDFADPSVQETVDRMLEVLNEDYVVGGIDAALGRGFQDGLAQVFKPEPEAAVHVLGGFAGGQAMDQINKELVEGETIDWFPFPSFDDTDPGSVTTFGGDVIGTLTASEGAKAFMEYIITPEANEVWASTGAIVSPHTGVGTEAYPNDLVVREAESLQEAEEIRYDGADLLPAGVQGEGFGPLLQRALRGDEIDWAEFEGRLQVAWENE